MMTHLKSKATKQDIAEYTTGSCHNFATAIHAHTGWKLLVAYENKYAPVIGKNGDVLYAVMHVAALDPEGYVWDVTGRVERKRAAAHFKKFMHFDDIGFELLDSPANLQKYIGFGDNQDLGEQYASDLVWADRDARRILRGMDVLPSPETMPEGAPGDKLGMFEQQYAEGIPSANLAYAFACHFGYPVVASFNEQGSMIRAWNEDFDGRPVTSSGVLEGYGEMGETADGTLTIWQAPKHFLADIRLRKLLGTGSLDDYSTLLAFKRARNAFPSITDRQCNGRWCTEEAITSTMAKVLEDWKYDREYGDLRKYARKGRPYAPQTALEPSSGLAPR